MVRCKFRVTKIEEQHYCQGQRLITLEPIHSPEVPEDQAFTKYTPWGEMKVAINNPAALEQLTLGRLFYLDLTPIADPQ